MVCFDPLVLDLIFSNYIREDIACECRCLWRPEAPESIGSAVTGSCEQSTVGARNQLKCSARLVCASHD